MTILAIDTSCDETSAAVTRGWTALSNVVASQAELHRPYGGVFPTVAKQAHRENIEPTVQLALKRAGIKPQELDAIAVTQGPGLAPALEVGIAHAKKLASEWRLPLIPVNHIEGHLWSVLVQPRRRTPSQPAPDPVATIQFPVLALIVSGKHTEFVLVHGFGTYNVLGRTLDDAAGECLDKIGRMLNLGYPAGPVLEQLAKVGSPTTAFPLPLTTVKTFDLSFSGLKTFARNTLNALGGSEVLSRQEVCDFAASTQAGVFRHITYKLEKVIEAVHRGTTEFDPAPVSELWLGGGVAANTALRAALRQTLRASSRRLGLATPLVLRTPYTKRLCGDNAGMIGVVGEKKATSQFLVRSRGITLERLPRLSLR